MPADGSGRDQHPSPPHMQVEGVLPPPGITPVAHRDCMCCHTLHVPVHVVCIGGRPGSPPESTGSGTIEPSRCRRSSPAGRGERDDPPMRSCCALRCHPAACPPYRPCSKAGSQDSQAYSSGHCRS